MELKDRIRSARRRIVATQAEFAESVGTSQKVVSRWEKGVKPQQRMLERIARAANVSFDWLAYGTGEISDAAALSEEERQMLELYRSVPEDRMRYEFVARLAHAQKFLDGIDSLGRRIDSIFFDFSPDKREEILEYLQRRLRGLYDQLAATEAERQIMLAELSEGHVDQTVIDHLNGLVVEIQNTIQQLQRFNRRVAVDQLEELEGVDMGLELLLQELRQLE